MGKKKPPAEPKPSAAQVRVTLDRDVYDLLAALPDIGKKNSLSYHANLLIREAIRARENAKKDK
jgi:DNA helicase TIP49 (TBP-interacting protein)